MLALTRKIGERIVIRVPGMERPIIIGIADIRRNADKVRLAFDAQDDVSIDREEIDIEKQEGRTPDPQVTGD